MPVKAIRKTTEIAILITGFILLAASVTLFGKPSANQGVAALPHKYSLSIRTISAKQNSLPAAGLSSQGSVPQVSGFDLTSDSGTPSNSPANKTASLSATLSAVEEKTQKVIDQANQKVKDPSELEQGTL